MNRISAIVNRRRAITVDTAIRLARYFGTSPQYWLNLQVAYDIEVAVQEIQPQIEKEVRPRTAAWTESGRTTMAANPCAPPARNRRDIYNA
jgi:plasmid maintenance system antidote protein VapI